MKAFSHSRCIRYLQAYFWAFALYLSPLSLKADSTFKLAAPALASGAILLAEESLHDPSFTHSVVLLTEHGPRGAAGIILNRPSIVRVVDAIPMLREHLGSHEQVLYFGGPVSINRTLALTSTTALTKEATKIVGDLHVLYGIPKFLEHLSAHKMAEKTRFYIGYAGWGPKQLEAEISRGDWLIIDAKTNIVFSENVDTLWRDLHATFSGSWTLQLIPRSAQYSSWGGYACNYRRTQRVMKRIAHGATTPQFANPFLEEERCR